MLIAIPLTSKDIWVTLASKLEHKHLSFQPSKSTMGIEDNIAISITRLSKETLTPGY